MLFPRLEPSGLTIEIPCGLLKNTVIHLKRLFLWSESKESHNDRWQPMHSDEPTSVYQQWTLVLTAATASSQKLFADEDGSRLRIGLVTDLHYADKPPAGTRHYRETLAKLEESASQFEKDKPEFLVELGDLIDAAESVEVEQRYLRVVNREFSAIGKDRHYVLGNHCVDTLRKEEFLGKLNRRSLTIPLTVAAFISSCWIPASARMACPTPERTSSGRMPTSRPLSLNGSRPI